MSIKYFYTDSGSNWTMNSLNILLPYPFVIKSIELNWYDISFAVSNGFLSHQDAVEHAIQELSLVENPSTDVLSLAILTPAEAIYPHSIQPYLENLASSVAEQDKKTAKQKILYLVLKWIFEHQVDFKDPLETMEFIYADFDYPDSISHFIRYKPPLNSNSEILNTEELFKRLNCFLQEQKKLYEKS